MVEKDYYAILGVPRTAGAEEIRDAFRELAKKYHPDRVGPEGTAFFQDIVQAYAVLSDPQKRREYNQHLHHREQQRRGYRYPPRPGEVEPLIPTGPSWSRPRRTYARDMLRPFWEPWSTPAAANMSSWHVEIILSPEEAAGGGTLPLEVPLLTTCPACRGSGRGWYFRCPTCGGQGTLTRRQTLPLRIPPQVQDGTVLQVPLDALGLSQVLHVLFRVSA